VGGWLFESGMYGLQYDSDIRLRDVLPLLDVRSSKVGSRGLPCGGEGLPSLPAIKSIAHCCYHRSIYTTKEYYPARPLQRMSIFPNTCGILHSGEGSQYVQIAKEHFGSCLSLPMYGSSKGADIPSLRVVSQPWSSIDVTLYTW
jgi:hypothetical protein